MEEHTGHRARMRERFRSAGLEGFAPHEVLELILFYAIPQRNVNPIAHRLLERFGSLHGVLEASPEALETVDGIGENAATLLSLFAQVSRRLEKSRAGEKPCLSDAVSAGRHCLALLSGLRQEHFYLICLNARLELLGDALIAKGSLSEVLAYPRLAAEAALQMNAHTVMLAHNHPGGTCEPSAADLEATERLWEMFRGLDISLADHWIIADEKAISLASRGMMPGEKGHRPAFAAEGKLP